MLRGTLCCRYFSFSWLIVWMWSMVEKPLLNPTYSFPWLLYRILSSLLIITLLRVCRCWRADWWSCCSLYLLYPSFCVLKYLLLSIVVELCMHAENKFLVDYNISIFDVIWPWSFSSSHVVYGMLHLPICGIWHCFIWFFWFFCLCITVI